jgi:hypothetical protein
MSKNLDKKIDVYISTCYVLTKLFHGKPTFGVKKGYLRYVSFVFFTQAIENIIFL